MRKERLLCGHLHSGQPHQRVRRTVPEKRLLLDFADANQEVDTLLVHCYAGQSRSKAVGKFLYDVYHKKYPSLVLETAETGVPNEYVYNVLDAALLIRRLQMLGM